MFDLRTGSLISEFEHNSPWTGHPVAQRDGLVLSLGPELVWLDKDTFRSSPSSLGLPDYAARICGTPLFSSNLEGGRRKTKAYVLAASLTMPDVILYELSQEVAKPLGKGSGYAIGPFVVDGHIIALTSEGMLRIRGDGNAVLDRDPQGGKLLPDSSPSRGVIDGRSFVFVTESGNIRRYVPASGEFLNVPEATLLGVAHLATIEHDGSRSLLMSSQQGLHVFALGAGRGLCHSIAEPFSSPPCIVGEYIFATSDRGGSIHTLCSGPQKTSPVWVTNPETNAAAFGQPVYGDRRVLVHCHAGKRVELRSYRV